VFADNRNRMAKRLIVGGSTSVVAVGTELASAYHQANPKISARRWAADSRTSVSAAPPPDALTSHLLGNPIPGVDPKPRVHEDRAGRQSA